MRQFWDIALEPILRAAAPRRILEIGVDQGLTTKHLLEFAVAGDAFLDAIDPNPKVDTADWQRERPDHIRFHRGLSVDVIPGLEPPDVVLVDGDHNWYTVHSELVLLDQQAAQAGQPPPLVLLHDAQWPYARRDLYYDPGTIPKTHRHPHEKAGLLPDRSEVVEDGGLNAHLEHAIFEGGEHNGVLTAVEDFLAASGETWKFTVVPGLNGLGILAPTARLSDNKALRDVIAALGRAPALRRVVALVERERLEIEIRRQAAQRRLLELEADAEQLTAARGELERLRAEHERLAAELRATDPSSGNAAVASVESEAAEQASAQRLADAEAALQVSAHQLADAEAAAQDFAQRLADAGVVAQQLTERADQAEAAAREATLAAERAELADVQLQEAMVRVQRAETRAQDDARRLETVEFDRHSEQQRRIDAERELLTMAREQAALAGRVEAQEAELASLRDESQASRALALSAGTQARAAREEADELAHARDRSERRKQTLERREEELEQELVVQRRQLREAAERQAEFERTLGVLERRIEEVTATHDERIVELIRGHDVRVDALTRERDELAEQRNREQDELERGAAEAAAARDAAEQRFAEQAAELQIQAAELETQAAARMRQAADAADARESMERALEDAHAQAADTDAALREVRERLEVTEMEADARDAEVAELQLALARAHADAERARAQAMAADARALDAQLDPAARPAPPAPTRPSIASVAAPAPAPARAPAAVVEPLAPVPDPAAQGSSDPPPAAALQPNPLRIDFNEHELAAHEYFRSEYDGEARAPGVPPIVDPVALPAVCDQHGHLVAEHDTAATEPTVDVVVCVHNALADVRTCLWSVAHKTDRSYRLVIVNDGSDEDTTAYLEQVAADVPQIRLVHREHPPHGYTIAANLGLRAATGDYVVLLNSDTIVTRGWLDRIVDCGESDPNIGILGPLSNAASHQSIPELRDAAGWSINPLPPFTTPDGIAKLLQRVSPRERPRLPFVNGFCYVIKRAVIDAIGVFDEEHFASGYCEENDFSYRAGQAGFELAVVDDGYVFHAKSKSFGVATRKVIAKRNYEIFLDKHGREQVQAAVKGMERNTALAPLRAKVSDALSSPFSLVAALDSANHEALKIMFVLPGLGQGGSGGSHSIYQEVHGLRALGLDAQIALRAKSFERARGAYDDADEVFVPYGDERELEHVTAQADVIAATHFKSAVLVAELQSRRSDFLPAYYVQDYEPFFTSRDSADVQEAIESYTLIPGCLLFAKTHWLCNIVSRRHGVFVAKVEPSIDEQIYRPSGARRAGGPLRVTAMVRPRTPRRQPTATVAVLEQLSLERGGDVDVTTFGCAQADLERLTDHPPLLGGHRGLLRRAEVADLLGASDVFVDLSMYQAFGRTALEAMACGTTAVVPRLGGVWEFLEHDVNGIAVDAFAPQQALGALAALADDRPRLESLQAASRQTGARYSIQRAALSEYLVFAHAHAARLGASARA